MKVITEKFNFNHDSITLTNTDISVYMKIFKVEDKIKVFEIIFFDLIGKDKLSPGDSDVIQVAFKVVQQTLQEEIH